MNTATALAFLKLTISPWLAWWFVALPLLPIAAVLVILVTLWLFAAYQVLAAASAADQDTD